MVFYFTSNVVEPSAFIYVGKDKFESMLPTWWNLGNKLVNNGALDEDLIKYGLDNDVWYVPRYTFAEFWDWYSCATGSVFPPPTCDSGNCPNTSIHLQFHVDNLSSAHVYVRLREGETWDNIAQPLLEDCAQLTKANSIEGQSSTWTQEFHTGGDWLLERKQEGQHHHHLHTMVKPEERRVNGGRSSHIP